MGEIFKRPKKGAQTHPVKRDDGASVQKYTFQDLHREHREQSMRIVVTQPHYDDIAKILDSMKIEYTPYDGTFECDFLFLNCGTADHVPAEEVRRFVERGGCLYASDWTSSIVDRAFPNVFDFAGNSGETGTVTARVCDGELRDVIGDTIDILFDLGGWSVLNSVRKGNVILESTHTRKPLMVMMAYEKGTIFYTCFHNHSQISRTEEILMQLLVLKQISAATGVSLERAGERAGVSLVKYRKEMQNLKKAR